jgi:hypothetical protein
VDFQTIEISALATVVSPVGVVSGRFGIDSASINSNVIADFDWAAIDEENVLGTGHLMQSAEPLEERSQHRIQRVEPPIEAAPTEPTAEVGRALKQVQSSQKNCH